VGKSKAQLAREKRWENPVTKLFSSVMFKGVDQALSMMGVAVRSAENAIARLTYFANKVRERTLSVMLTNNLDEHRASKMTFLRLDDVLTIKKNDAGRATLEKLQFVLGAALARKLVTRRTVRVPARTEVIYEINEEFLGSLGPEKARQIAKILGNTPKLYVGDVPKRVKQGKPRRKREGSRSRKR
jgi:hypothetical protein